MKNRAHSLTIATGMGLMLASCGPADPFDSEYVEQFENADQKPSQSFASGYFPDSFGQPSIDCGNPDTPIPLVGEVEQEWYPSQWMAAREPSLYQFAMQERPPEFVLRFSYIPSFSPSIFVRIHSDENGLRLIAKKLNGAGGYEPGTVAQSKEVRLNPEQTTELLRMLEEENLFGEAPDLCQFGFDGSKWLFEKVDSNGYAFVKRWSPTGGASFNLGKHLLELSGWPI